MKKDIVKKLPCLLLAVLLLPEMAAAQTLRPSPAYRPASAAQASAAPAAKDAAVPEAATIPLSESLQQYITRLVLDDVPREYENTKKWGGTKRVMSGLDWELDGLRLETRRQWRDANHGTWTRYKLKLVDPEETFQVRIENLRDLGDGRAAFDLVGLAQLDCSGRLAEWRRGVQVVSLSAEADAQVRLVAAIELKLRLDGQTFPPDVLLDPQVVAADLQLQQFKLRRVSKASGPLVRGAGEVVEEGLQEYLAEHRDKLAEKMNRQIDKQRDKLRIPVSKLAATAFEKLPASITPLLDKPVVASDPPASIEP